MVAEEINNNQCNNNVNDNIDSNEIIVDNQIILNNWPIYEILAYLKILN